MSSIEEDRLEPRVGSPRSLSEQVASYPFWYHTLELGQGVVTPGAWDLRPVLPLLPWPDVTGKRCLDVGTFNGFFAFELERRGASEVVAVDLLDSTEIDWPRDVRPGMGDPGWEDKFAGTDFSLDGGFRIAAAALGSAVDWRHCSIYDLDPTRLGTFDVVVCGSLLLHLRDPVRALEAVRSVCSGVFLSSEAIDLWLSVLRPRSPAARFDGIGNKAQWWTPNSAGHVRMLASAGFAIVRRSRPYLLPYGPRGTQRTPRNRAVASVERWATRSRAPGLLHRATLARPAE